MVTNRTITTDHGYKLGRLANQDLADPKAITDLASRNMYYTEAAINKASAGIAAENRIRELTNKGPAVIDMDQFRTSNPTTLTWMHIDARAHTKEPRHRIAVSPNKQGTVSERKACTDRGRHETDGDSELKETDPNAPWEAQRAERQAQNERDLAAANQGRIALAHHLAQVNDDTAIATALRLIAYESLPLPPADDPLLPLPDTYNPADRAWGCPPVVIEKAEPADLARAFIQEAFTSDDPEWWRSNNPNGAAAKHDARTALGIPRPATPDSD